MTTGEWCLICSGGAVLSPPFPNHANKNIPSGCRFNVPWGQMFKAGIHDSRFAKQVRLHCSIATIHKLLDR